MSQGGSGVSIGGVYFFSNRKQVYQSSSQDAGYLRAIHCFIWELVIWELVIYPKTSELETHLSYTTYPPVGSNWNGI